ncbi:hypothetical protein MHZ92_08160 [Sporosarcina sp. ACRSL]|uniref:hypothetical protein n=1 Tax=Sporosarcina sp. ACRSL TaxID=2918215 RepID=UPI001EF5C042|nr:hypothetical protein [Sporosarcina sp. ACRSL]MCG7344102.1 hypothetical protein [Sporosarcina sp. ACRSL]
MGLIGFFITTFILFVILLAIIGEFMKDVEPETADETLATGIGQNLPSSGVGASHVAIASEWQEDTELTDLLEEMEREEAEFQRFIESNKVDMPVEEEAPFQVLEPVHEEMENLATFTHDSMILGMTDLDNYPPNPYETPGIDQVIDMDYHGIIDNPLDMLEDINTLDDDPYMDHHYGGDEY